MISYYASIDKQMGSVINNSIKIQNEINNSFLQSLSQTCQADCKADASGNTIIISGNAGNVSITARCTASASCAMTNQAEAATQNVIDNLIKQEITTVTDFMGDLSFQTLNNNVNIVNSINNYITQISTQTCNAVADATADNNFIYVKSGATAGNFTIDATGDANASCAMSNMSKIQAFNQVQNNVTQTTTTIGMFAMIFIVIGIVVLVGGIIFVIMYSSGALGKAAKGDGIGDDLDISTVNQLLNSSGKVKGLPIPPV